MAMRTLLAGMRVLAAYERERGGPPLHAFVLARGERFRVAPLTAREREVVDAARGRKETPATLCFENAQKVLAADASGELAYAEGFALGGSGSDVPIHHGWLVLGRKVVDLTWSPPGLAYFGVRFSRHEVVRIRAAGTRRCTTLLDDCEAGYPLLRTPSETWRGWKHETSGRKRA